MSLALLNVGFPMMAALWPLSWLALVPVILIEWLVVRRRAALATAPAGKAIAWANVASSIVGVPLAWFAWLVLGRSDGDRRAFNPDGSRSIEDVILGAAWLPPQGPSSLSPSWEVPLALCVLLIPCFFVSLLIEHWVCRVFWKGVAPRDTLRSVLRMNLASYAFLLVVIVGFSVVEGRGS